MKDIKIIGGGPGDKAYILPAARQAVEECDLVIGDKRLLRTFELEADEKHIFERSNYERVGYERKNFSFKR